MIDHIAHLRELHHRRIEPVTGPPLGASETEVAELSAVLGTSLPAAYVQFLLWMGNDRHGIYRGTNIFITDVVRNTEYLPELLAGNDVSAPQGRVLCFQSHQGYFKAWFALPPESDDPPVFYFGEGQNMTEPAAVASFTEYLAAELTDLADIGGSARSDRPTLFARLKAWLLRGGPPPN